MKLGGKKMSLVTTEEMFKKYNMQAKEKLEDDD